MTCHDRSQKRVHYSLCRRISRPELSSNVYRVFSFPKKEGWIQTFTGSFLRLTRSNLVYGSRIWLGTVRLPLDVICQDRLSVPTSSLFLYPYPMMMFFFPFSARSVCFVVCRWHGGMSHRHSTENKTGYRQRFTITTVIHRHSVLCLTVCNLWDPYLWTLKMWTHK